MSELQLIGMTKAEAERMAAAIEARILANLRGMLSVVGVDTTASGTETQMPMNPAVGSLERRMQWQPGDIRVMGTEWHQISDTYWQLWVSWGIYLPKDDDGNMLPFFYVNGNPVSVDPATNNVEESSDPGWWILKHDTCYNKPRTDLSVDGIPGIAAHIVKDVFGSTGADWVNNPGANGCGVRFYSSAANLDPTDPACDSGPYPPQEDADYGFATQLCRMHGGMEVQLLRRGVVRIETGQAAGDAVTETRGDADIIYPGGGGATQQTIATFVNPDIDGYRALGIHNVTQTATTKTTGDKLVGIRNVAGNLVATMLEPWIGSGDAIGDADATTPTSKSIELIPATDPQEFRLHNVNASPIVIPDITEAGVVFVDTTGDVPETKLAEVSYL